MLTRDSILPWFPLRFLLGMVGAAALHRERGLDHRACAGANFAGACSGSIPRSSPPASRSARSRSCSSGLKAWPPFLARRRRLPWLRGHVSWRRGVACPQSIRRGEHASVRSFLPLAPVLLFAVFVTARSSRRAFRCFRSTACARDRRGDTMSALLACSSPATSRCRCRSVSPRSAGRARTTLAACAAARRSARCLIPLVIETPLIWPLIFLWGAASFGLYTLALVEPRQPASRARCWSPATRPLR